MILNDPKTFVVDVEGSITKQRFQGLFKVRPLLSHRDKLRRDELKRSLIGAQPDATSVNAMRISEIFSKIWAHTVEAPSWWKDAGNGLDLIDEEPVVAVIDKIVELEQELLGTLTKAGEEAKATLADVAKKG
jgi:hypothetical protein